MSTLVGHSDPEATVVCEASSFQLEDAAEFAPEGAVLLNIEADHLDRHGTFESYRQAKLRAFAHQGEDDVAVLPEGFGAVPGRGRRVTFGAGQADVSVADGHITWEGEPLMRAADLRLRGAHNLENAMAAAAVALARGVPAEAVAEAFRTFAGVPHRLEEVARVDGVLYVNDSKATNPASAVRGIEAFPGGVHAILGGSLKGGDFLALREPVAARCEAAYLLGPAADGAGPGPGRHGAAARLGHAGAGGGRAPPRRPRPGTWCCSPRPARPSTPSATTRTAAAGSGSSWPRWDDSALRRRTGP